MLLDFLGLLFQIILVRIQNFVLVLLVSTVVRKRLQDHLSSEVADEDVEWNLASVIHVHHFLVERCAVLHRALLLLEVLVASFASRAQILEEALYLRPALGAKIRCVPLLAFLTLGLVLLCHELLVD